MLPHLGKHAEVHVSLSHTHSYNHPQICTEEFLSCLSHKPHPEDTLMTTSFVPQRWGLPPDLIL